MYTEEQYIQLEQEERDLTDEAIILMLLVLSDLKGNVEKELREFYSKYGEDGVVTYTEARKWISEQDKRRRLTALSIVIGGAFVVTLSKLEKEFRTFLSGISSKECTFFGVSIAIDKLLTHKWGVDDLYWLQRLENDVDLWQAYILSDIKRSMLQKKDINQVLKLLDKRFVSINKILERLGLTESTAVGSLTRQAIFKELGINKYQFYTKADERTCDVCGSMHGLIFPISAYEVGSTASPLHPRCRCWEVPIME